MVIYPKVVFVEPWNVDGDRPATHRADGTTRQGAMPATERPGSGRDGAAGLELDTPPPAPDVIHSRAHTTLSFPHVITPLGWSMVGPLGEQSARRTWQDGFGFFDDLDQRDEYVFLGRFGGRLYANVSTFREMSGRTPGADWHHTDEELGGVGAASFPAHHEPAGTHRWWLRTLPRSGRTVLLRRRRHEQAHVRVARAVLATDRMIAAPSDDAALVTHLRWLLTESIEAWAAFVSARAPTMGYVRWVTNFANRIGCDTATVQRRFASIPDLVSTQPALELLDLARTTAPSSSLTAAIRDAAGPDALEAGGVPGSSEVARRFRRIARRHGHRGVAEADPAEPTWEYDANPLWVALVALLDVDADDRARRRTSQRAEADAALRRETRGVPGAVLRHALDRVEAELVLVEQGKSVGLLCSHQMRRVVFELRRRWADSDLLAPEHFRMLTIGELEQIVAGDRSPLDEVTDRHASWVDASNRRVPEQFIGPFPGFLAPGDGSEDPTAVDHLTGIAGAPGVARGRAVVVVRPEDAALRPGDILVARATDTAWTPLFLCASGVVCDLGAAMSHATIVARDLAIPAVVDTRTATTAIRTGDRIEVDGTTGVVTILRQP